MKVDEIYHQLLSVLDDIAITAANKLDLAERSYQAAQTNLQTLEEYEISGPFEDREQEIIFFKEAKPMFIKELIYYRELFRIEADLPVGNSETIKSYYRRIQDYISYFFERNQLIYNYYRLGSPSDNGEYPFHNLMKPPHLHIKISEIDAAFWKANCYKLGKMMAYEKINEYLSMVMEKPAEQKVIQGENNKFSTTWTHSKAQLIEIGYSLFANKAINNGNADIKQIMGALQYIFNIDLGNYYGVFQQNIRMRKKNRTPYLGDLEQSLVKYMDDLDQHPRQYPLTGR